MNSDQSDHSLLLHIACSLSQGIGPQKFNKIFENFSTCDEIFAGDISVLRNMIGGKEADNLRSVISSKSVERAHESYLKRGIYTIHRKHALYPHILRQLPDAPICLYFRSAKDPAEYLTKISKTTSLAVVGSRKHTTYGRVATEGIVSVLARSGMAIISGMALGIDAIAHNCALRSNGHTIAVLGCGVDIVYPSDNRFIYDEILSSGNCIVSEFPPGTQPTKGSFIARNRIVSGISSGILIIEGDERSGSLTTAGFAAEQGKDIFALPGPITSPLSQAPLKLLKNGAFLVTQAEDILDFYKMSADSEVGASIAKLTPDEDVIRLKLKERPFFIDEIASELSVSVVHVTNMLTQLEIKGIINRDVTGRYHLSSIKN